MLADLNSIASVDKGRVEKVVDWIANGNSTSILPGGKLPLDYYNADYILGECQTSQRIQMRFHALDVVNTTNWEPKGYSYLIFMPLFYNNLDNKRTSYLPFAFGDYVASIDPNSDYFHVFFTGVMRKKNGDSIIGRSNMGSPEPKVSLIVIEASTFNTMDFRDAARLLVHEFGHEAGGLVHAEGPCQGNPGSNIMCPLIAGPTGAGDYWGMQGTRSQCGFLYDTHRLRNGTHQYR